MRGEVDSARGGCSVIDDQDHEEWAALGRELASLDGRRFLELLDAMRRIVDGTAQLRGLSPALEQRIAEVGLDLVAELAGEMERIFARPSGSADDGPALPVGEA